MRQLSIIYLVSGSVLLVGVLLISMSPDHRQALSALQNPGPITLHHAGHLPLYFMPHQGEPTEKTVFYAQTSHYTMWTTSEGLVFDRGGKAAAGEENISRLVFLNANRDPGIIPLEITPHLGTASAKAILYKDLYDRIDLKIRGNESQIEYTWIVKPGGNPADIRFEYKNVKAAGIDNQWNLAIETPAGELTQQKPSSYQLIAGEKRTIHSHFEPIAKNLFGFRIKAFDRDHDLIIDPPVSFELYGGRKR